MSKDGNAIDDDSVATADQESLRRALRDLEVTQARVRRDAERIYDEKRRELVYELLPVLDNLERTLAAAVTASDAVLVEGLRMVHMGLEGVLVRYGVECVEAAGLSFDPAIHEAVAAVPVTDPKLVSKVVHQVAPGYRFGGQVLRAARVTVGVLASSTATADPVGRPVDRVSAVQPRRRPRARAVEKR